MRDGNERECLYVIHIEIPPFLSGGLDSSACGCSLASLIRNRIVEYETPKVLQFSEETAPVQEDTSPLHRKED